MKDQRKKQAIPDWQLAEFINENLRKGISWATTRGSGYPLCHLTVTRELYGVKKQGNIH